uniref:PAX-interacting protein 1 n=1 Tax=Mola mola TaxID=94237 RepID=A0A3Q4BZY6_MOLML
MSDEENKVSDELFKDVKFYVVGDIDHKVVDLLKAGKGKEVSYNALATHIIAEDGDNPEVGESREVFDLPVVKPSWVILSVRCGDLLPVTGFSPESGQIFFGLTACLPKVSSVLFCYFYNVLFGFYLVYFFSVQAKFECALKHPGIKIVTPDWITDSVKDKSRKDEAHYHPRLTYVEPEEEEGSEAESYDQQSHSDGSYSPRQSRLSSCGSSGEDSVSPSSPRKPQHSSERMFDDSDDDSSTEKEGTNLNWTLADVRTPTSSVQSGTSRRQGGPPGSKGPVSGSGLINLCATVPGSGGAIPAENIPGWSPVTRTLRNITNNSDIQATSRPVNVGHIVQNLTANQTKPIEHQTNQSHTSTPNSTNPLLFNQSKMVNQTLITEQQQSYQAAQQQHQQLPQQPQHPIMHLQQQHQMIQLHHQQQQSQVSQQGFQQLPQQQQQFLQQQQQQMHQQQIFSQQQNAFSQQQLRPQQLIRPGLQQLQQQQVLQQQLQQFQQQQRMQMLQQQQQNQHQLHLQQQQQQQQQQHFLQQQHMHQQHLQNQQQQALQHQNQQALQQQPQTTLQPQQLQQPPHIAQLFGHEPGQEIPMDGFLLGCVFAIADYPEQMADKQLLSTWKRVIQACGGSIESTITSRCTHLMCESQVSNMYVQALREGKRCVTVHWLNTVLKKNKMVPPHRTLHLPFAFPPGAKPCSQHIISVTGFVDADRDDLKLMAYLTGARFTGYLCHSNTVLICKEPVGFKYEKAKEWKIPCVNAQWLCDIMLGNFEALRQIQHSRYSIYTHPEPLVPNPQLVQNLLGILQLLKKEKMTDSNNQPANKKARSVQAVAGEYKTLDLNQRLPGCHVIMQFCLCRLEEIQSPNKKLPPESTPQVMFTGFEPTQVQQYTKVISHCAKTSNLFRPD